jgi:hypothetical protein
MAARWPPAVCPECLPGTGHCRPDDPPTIEGCACAPSRFGACTMKRRSSTTAPCAAPISPNPTTRRSTPSTTAPCARRSCGHRAFRRRGGEADTRFPRSSSVPPDDDERRSTDFGAVERIRDGEVALPLRCLASRISSIEARSEVAGSRDIATPTGVRHVVRATPKIPTPRAPRACTLDPSPGFINRHVGDPVQATATASAADGPENGIEVIG